jgi:hypothetical protein
MLPSVLEGDLHATGTAAEDEYTDVTGDFSSTAGMVSLGCTMDLTSSAPQTVTTDDDVSVLTSHQANGPPIVFDKVYRFSIAESIKCLSVHECTSSELRAKHPCQLYHFKH